MKNLLKMTSAFLVFLSVADPVGATSEDDSLASVEREGQTGTSRLPDHAAVDGRFKGCFKTEAECHETCGPENRDLDSGGIWIKSRDPSCTAFPEKPVGCYCSA